MSEQPKYLLPDGTWSEGLPTASPTVRPSATDALRAALAAQLVDLASKPPTAASLRALEHAAAAGRDLLVAVESPEALLNYLPGPNGDFPAEAAPSETFGVSFLRQMLPALQEMQNPKHKETVSTLLMELASAQDAGAPPEVLATIQRKIETLTGASGTWTKPTSRFGLVIPPPAYAAESRPEEEP